MQKRGCSSVGLEYVRGTDGVAGSNPAISTIGRGSSGVEHATENRSVGGSIPPLGTKRGSSLVVERLVANEKIAGSTPVSRSNFHKQNSHKTAYLSHF